MYINKLFFVKESEREKEKKLEVIGREGNENSDVFKFVSKEKSFLASNLQVFFLPKLISVDFKALLFFLIEFLLLLNILSYTSYSTL